MFSTSFSFSGNRSKSSSKDSTGLTFSTDPFTLMLCCFRILLVASSSFCFTYASESFFFFFGGASFKNSSSLSDSILISSFFFDSGTSRFTFGLVNFTPRVKLLNIELSIAEIWIFHNKLIILKRETSMFTSFTCCWGRIAKNVTQKLAIRKDQ